MARACGGGSRTAGDPADRGGDERRAAHGSDAVDLALRVVRRQPDVPGKHRRLLRAPVVFERLGERAAAVGRDARSVAAVQSLRAGVSLRHREPGPKPTGAEDVRGLGDPACLQVGAGRGGRFRVWRHRHAVSGAIIVAIVSGVLSACFNFGIEAGKPMADTANIIWKTAHPAQGNFLFQNNVTYIIILWGGLTTNLIWCAILNYRNRTFGDYTNHKNPLLKNYLFCALAGTTWFLQFFFYGMGESKLGNGASSWILHMAFIILTANIWGLLLKEWKGLNRKTILTLIAGILIIVISILVVGYGNSIKQG